MQDAIEALADPRRRRILELVRDDELPAGVIASHFADVTRPAISQHLRALLGAGLVVERREGTRRLYRARPDGLGELRAYLDGFWDSRLEILRREAERAEKEKVDDRN